MITVAGGVYRERCIHPHWDQLLGSGGRAVATLSPRTETILHTYCDVDAREELEARMRSHRNVEFRAAPIAKLIEFDYVHPLSAPRILPPPHTLAKSESLHVTGEVVLRFGMLEGDAIVNGDRVVYDPQSAYQVQGFRDNGSTAKSLAIVANSYEIRALTEQTNTVAGARALLAQESAQVVVAKLGSAGAFVVADAIEESIPAFESESVFSIGSGDVFASTFAYYWGQEKLQPLDAARLASKATSLYCESRSPAIPNNLECVSRQSVKLKEGRAYLAGPFFTVGQRWLVEEARAHLRSLGLEVFSPIHDVGPGPADKIAQADLEGLLTCDRVLALVDGADAGTLFEIGYARSRNIPVVAFSECLPEEHLKMIIGSGCRHVRDFATSIYATAWVRP